MTTPIRDRARRAVMEWLRPYVERGDTDQQIRQGCMARYSDAIAAQIGGGYLFCFDDRKAGGEARQRLRSDQVAVTRVDGEECCEVFALAEITGALRGRVAVQEALL